MKKNLQIVLIGSFIFGTIGIIIGLYFSHLIQFPTKILDIALWIGFWVFWVGVINEGFHWVKNGKRSDWADLVIIAFLFITVFLITRDVLLSFVGAFSIYLLFGIEELKEYEILNKIVLISVITYNVIFVAGILDQIFQKDGLWQNIAFSFSFWLILILGFVFFGRKYIIVFRFMSVQYLTLLLYVVAWLVIATINYVASIDLKEWIYEALIITNLIVYAFSGPLINLLMGFHRENDPELNQMVREVAKEVGLDPNKIQVRFGKYPILNAMAYGAFWNMNMAIIAPDKETIPMNEMKGIIAHELGHLKQKHTLILTIISTIEILLFQLLQWPVTMYDYVFNKENMPFELWVFLVINFGISIFLYIIVRYLEGNADKIAKKSGYSSSISKGLYNLESFYATSHEVGLDATLLSDEKVTPNNQMLQYYSTAQYLNRMIVNPSRSILLSNFINSHPPSFHRIMIILNDQDVSSFRESLMPLVFLNRKKAREFSIQTNEARQKFMQLVNQKIEEKFHKNNIKEFNEHLKQKDYFTYKIGHSFAYLNIITGERWFGVLKSINYTENVTEPFEYGIEIVQKDGQKAMVKINPFACKEVQLAVGSQYKFKKEGILTLKNVNLETLYNPKSKKKVENDTYYKFIYTGVAEFIDLKGNIYNKPVFHTRFPIPVSLIKEYENQSIFLKKSGSFICLIPEKIQFNEENGKISISTHYFDETVALETSSDSKNYNLDSDSHVIKKEKLYFSVHNDKPETKKLETSFIQYLEKEKIRCIIVLKKAVNSEIDGFITELRYDEKSTNLITHVRIKSIFEEEMEISLKKIDGIFLNFPALIVQSKSEISLFTKVIDKFQTIFHPERIYS
ncbi:MAG: hypothetical protein DRO88_01175 [Promethearchaeia archaeon]|nr:MAG: hypothetical protein DRO88_01175 [Candidatus Lokiarchaeia archaeon]